DIIDGHVHCFLRHQVDKLVDDVRYTGARRFCALVIARNDGSQQWDNALDLKRRLPDEAIVFGGLDFTTPDRPPYEEQLQKLMDLGCAGLKLLTGKPDR